MKNVSDWLLGTGVFRKKNSYKCYSVKEGQKNKKEVPDVRINFRESDIVANWRVEVEK